MAHLLASEPVCQLAHLCTDATTETTPSGCNMWPAPAEPYGQPAASPAVHSASTHRPVLHRTDLVPPYVARHLPGDSTFFKRVSGGTMPRKSCARKGCTKRAVSGGTQCCTAHGGGRRCQQDGCPMAAASGGMQFCKAHGGGKRCQEAGCSKAASGSTQYCMAHGGGKRCQEEGCSKALGRGTQHCKISHHVILPHS
jgi:hypothetical protein